MLAVRDNAFNERLRMKKIIILISLILSLLTGISAYSQEPTPTPLKTSNIKENKPAIKYKNTEYKQPNTNNLMADVNKIETVSPNQKEKTQTKNSGNKTTIKWTDCLLIFFTGVLAIFTALLWLSTNKMWKATKDSADAAKKAADAAKASADDLPKVERAYLSVSIRADMENWKNTNANQISPIDIEVCNYGRTPARVTEIITTTQIGESEDRNRINFGVPDVDEIRDAAGHFIARDSKETFSYYPHFLSIIGEWKGIEGGDYHITFSGEVRYGDIFGKDHITYFNWSLVSRFHRGFYINDPKLNYTT